MKSLLFTLLILLAVVVMQGCKATAGNNDTASASEQSAKDKDEKEKKDKKDKKDKEDAEEEVVEEESEPTFGIAASNYLGADDVMSYGCAPGGAGCFTDSTKYIAQAFTLTEDTVVCGLGLGVRVQNATSISIYTNDLGLPGSEIETLSDVTATASSDNQNGSFVNFCADSDEDGVVLEAGTYWMVAYYSSVPGNLNVTGRLTISQTGLATKTSANGADWSTATMYNGTRSLDLWVTGWQE